MRNLVIKSKYKANQVTQNPKDKLWYCIGHTGGKHWMPLSDGFKTQAGANKWNKLQAKADKAHLASILNCSYDKVSAYI
tara:strand:- start:159 stop:395 length:237 start_codon:yes stop_codon:yes gene_type:complete